MSILQYSDSINAPELQVWNNAAFDCEESEGGGFSSIPMKNSWSSLEPVFENHSESLESDCSKENLSPLLVRSPVSLKSSIPARPYHQNSVVENSQCKNPMFLGKNGGSTEDPSVISQKGLEQEGGKSRDEKKIDAEIAEIENEIKRLSSRLEALRIEKAERKLKMVEKRRRIVPAKFMETKQSVKDSEAIKRVEDTPLSSFRPRINRRGVSLGPAEIVSRARIPLPGKIDITPVQMKQTVKDSEAVKKIGETPLSSSKAKINRRGVSLGPAEIVTGARFRPPGKIDITPVQPIQSRQKSCFWKLQDIDEVKGMSQTRKTLSPSPKSRKTGGKILAQKQAATTVGSKKAVKKEDAVLSLVQPRKLFKDGEKSVPAKKPMKPGRVVASRYNQIGNQSTWNSSAANDARKRSLPETDRDDGKRTEKRRTSSVGSSGGTCGTEGRMKKRWEIPTDIVVYKSQEDEKPLSSISSVTDMLPKIKTFRCVNDSPRDSGPAKRVAEFMGKRSYFCPDEDVKPSVCQALSFAEEDEDEER